MPKASADDVGNGELLPLGLTDQFETPADARTQPLKDLRLELDSTRLENTLQCVVELGHQLSIGGTSQNGSTALTLAFPGPEKELQALKAAHNVRSPTFCLPPELLCQIFIVLVLSEGCIMDGFTGRRILSWIGIAHVCRYWRQVALDCPALWSDLSFLDSKQIEIFLARSRNEPLRLRAHDDRTAFTDAFLKVLSQTHRLASVDIEISSSNQMPRLLASLKGRAPILKSLSIWCSFGSGQLSDDLQVLEQGADSLETISFLRCDISWSQVPFSVGLRYLQLWNSSKSSRTHRRPTREELIVSLKNMPMLEHLDLFNFAPLPVETPGPSPPPTVSLPALSRLAIYDSTKAVAYFFNAVEIPGTTDIRIGFLDSQTSQVYGQAFTNLKRCLTGEMQRLLEENGIQKLEVSPPLWDDDYDIQFIQIELRFGAGEQSKDSPSISLFFAEEISEGRVTLAVCRGFNLSSLRALKVMSIGEDAFNGRLWHVFGELPMLCRISLEGGTAGEFASGWADGGDLSYPMFPALSLAEFTEIEWDAFAVEDLAKALRNRWKGQDLGPLKLEMHHCDGLCAEDYYTLRDSNVNVQVSFDSCGSWSEDEAGRDWDMDEESEAESEAESELSNPGSEVEE